MKAWRRKVNDPLEEFLDNGSDILKDDRFLPLWSFQQHRHSNTYFHVCWVAFTALSLAKRLHIKVDVPSLVRAGLLHDYYGYDWHLTKPKGHGHRHPLLAADNAKRDFVTNEHERSIISSHMWPIAFHRVPRSREGGLIALADKIVATKEVFSSDRFLERKQQYFLSRIGVALS